MKNDEAACRAAQGDCKSPLSAPLENLAISPGLMCSLCSQDEVDNGDGIFQRVWWKNPQDMGGIWKDSVILRALLLYGHRRPSLYRDYDHSQKFKRNQPHYSCLKYPSGGLGGGNEPPLNSHSDRMMWGEKNGWRVENKKILGGRAGAAEH